MYAYVYRWSVRSGDGIAVELLVTAPSVVVARRHVRRFLVDHDGEGWAVDGVSREMASIPPETSLLPRGA